jgi:5'-nucleotidase / UDP-sugar diphosphatase
LHREREGTGVSTHRSIRPGAGREFCQVVATTDVHSALDRAEMVAACLHQLRSGGALTADCGDFFEGTGYYVLGQGQAETALLCGLYDIAVPGNHGYQHYRTSEQLRAITVCANIADAQGFPAWPPLVIAQIRGRVTAITAVIGGEAFGSVPPASRAGHVFRDQAGALRDLHRRHRDMADSWVVLSHSGFDHDTRLAQDCPFINVIFAGHCHSPRYGPETAGGAVVVKGGELAAGYAAAWPDGGSWHARVGEFSATARSPKVPRSVARALVRTAGMRPSLHHKHGPVRGQFADRTLACEELLALVCAAARDAAGANAALVNLTCLRETRLGTILTAGDLMTIEPFGNTLITLVTPDASATAARLAAGTGPLGAAPRRLPHGPARVVTTDYLAATYLHGGPEQPDSSGFRRPLRDLVAELLLGQVRPGSEAGGLP